MVTKTNGRRLQLNLVPSFTLLKRKVSTSEGTDGRSIVSSPSVRNWKLRWRDNAKRTTSSVISLYLLLMRIGMLRSAKQAQDEANAAKAASGSASKIIIPGTPRHAGFGSTTRITQTPRRRAGI